jgi:hypothetical protein
LKLKLDSKLENFIVNDHIPYITRFIFPLKQIINIYINFFGRNLISGNGRVVFNGYSPIVGYLLIDDKKFFVLFKRIVPLRIYENHLSFA